MNEIEMFRKGFRKKNQGFKTGPIRGEKMPAFRQVAPEYPQQITD
jgi:hypothetical protein